jgi:cell division ATPase FtsA
MENPICCIEISSSSIKLIVGYYFKESVYILDSIESNRAYICNGHVSDVDQMSKGISELIQNVQHKLGIDISEVYLGFYPYRFKTEHKVDSTAVTSTEGIIEDYDSINLENKFKNGFNTQSQIICDLSPNLFNTDDGKVYNIYPKGSRSRTLGMDADAMFIDKDYYEEVIRVFNSCNIRIKRTCFIPNACNKYMSSFDPNLKNFILIDFQNEATFVSIIYNGKVKESTCFGYGYNKITQALMENLQIDQQLAEYYKNVYGICEEPRFDFKTKQNHTIKQIKEIIIKSVEILYNNLYTFLSGFTTDYRQNIIITGEGSNLVNLGQYLSAQLNMKTTKFAPITPGARNSASTNLVSMIYYFETYQLKNYSRVSAVGFTRPNTSNNPTTTRTISIHDITSDETEKL